MPRNIPEEEEAELDEYDLTQLPGVDEALAERLIEAGFESLWDISTAEVDELERVGGITRNAAEKMIAAAKKFLGFEGDEEWEDEDEEPEEDEEEWEENDEKEW